MTSMETKLRARYVVPVAAPAIEDGIVVMRGDRIVATGPAREMDTGDCEDLGDVAIIPGLINAHTHLELSQLHGEVPPGGDLTAWLKDVRAHMVEKGGNTDWVGEGMQCGLAMSQAAGVTTVGDVTRFCDMTRPLFAASGLGGVSFGEIIAIGNQREHIEERLRTAAGFDGDPGRIRIGISPHSPYALEPKGMRTCAKLAAARELPISIHLCESPEEELFTRAGAGMFADHLKRLGVWDENIPIPGVGPVEVARDAGLLTRRTIIAHGNYLSEDYMEMVLSAGASVAYCPRTHTAFQHSPHRFRRMLEMGINVCLGTDSLASNPDLSVLEEMRFLHKTYPEFPCNELLRMGTLRAANALGLGEEVGSIEPGKRADFAIVPCEPGTEGAGWELIFQSDAPPRAVYLGGVRCHPAA